MKHLFLIIIFLFTPACSYARDGGEVTPTQRITNTPSLVLVTREPETTEQAPELTAQVTPSPTPTVEKTPSTPTRIPTPYIVEVIDWDLVESRSSKLCPDCEISLTSIQVPRQMSIAVVRVFNLGDEDAESRVTTNMLYASSDELYCKGGGEGHCGLIFGQVYTSPLQLTAEYVIGEAHELLFMVTFQEWAGKPHK